MVCSDPYEVVCSDPFKWFVVILSSTENWKPTTKWFVVIPLKWFVVILLKCFFNKCQAVSIKALQAFEENVG